MVEGDGEAASSEVVVMAGPWICLTVSSMFRGGDKDCMVDELCRVFGDDLSEMRVVCDDDLEAMGEYYVFVRC